MSTVGYRRVSTTDQNIGRQDLGDVDRLFEEKLSGKDRERPQLAACLAYLRDGDTLRVYSVDRLGRSLSDLLDIVAEVLTQGASVEFLKEGLTFNPHTQDPFKRMQLQMLAVFAEFERAIARGRQEEGIALARERGLNRPAPKVEPGDRLFIWKGRTGFIAETVVTGPARTPKSREDAPWPGGLTRWRAVFPIRVVREVNESYKLPFVKDRQEVTGISSNSLRFGLVPISEEAATTISAVLADREAVHPG